MSVRSIDHKTITGKAPNITTFLKIGLLIGSLAIAAKAVQKIYNYCVADSPFPYVSKKCSSKAHTYLKGAIPFPAPGNYPLVRGYFKAATQEASDRFKELFIEKSAEEVISGVPVLVATPKGYKENSKILVYIHGGAWVMGDPDHLYQVFAPIAHGASLKTFAIRYSLAPEFPFPQGLDDCFAVYEELLKTYDPKNIYFLGDSAGANLCIATILKARDKGLPMPRAVALDSPVVDIKGEGETYRTLAGRDPKFNFEESLKPCFDVYSTDTENPLVSVIHADFKKGFPPVTIHAGTREVLLSDSCMLNEELLNSGQQSSLVVLEGLWHGFKEHGYPDSNRSNKLMIEFFKTHV